jgi:hypothetical protein
VCEQGVARGIVPCKGQSRKPKAESQSHWARMRRPTHPERPELASRGSQGGSSPCKHHGNAGSETAVCDADDLTGSGEFGSGRAHDDPTGVLVAQLSHGEWLDRSNARQGSHLPSGGSPYESGSARGEMTPTPAASARA